MILTSPPITELTTEAAPLNLLGEWLRGWFNGSQHAVGANSPLAFPAVNLAFNQSAPVQPLYQFGLIGAADTTIRVVVVPRSEEASSLDTCLFSGKLATDRVLLNFYITSKHAGEGQAQQAAQTVAQLLKALLSNPDTRWPLVSGGITAFAPEPIRTIASQDYAQRLVACAAQFQYPIRFGVQGTPPAGAPTVVVQPQWPQSIEAFQPQALIVGEYLLGRFTAACRLQLTAAAAVAFAGQGGDTVLGLEIAGVQSGVTLALLPNAAANVEVQASASLSNLVVTAGQVLRWQVLSGPAPASAAWRASVELTAVPLPG